MLLLGVAVGASMVRGPALTWAADSTAAKGPAHEETTSTAPANAPMDVLFLPASADTCGVLMVRPAAIFGRPGMEPHARTVNRFIDDFFKSVPMGGWANLGVPIEEIDQISGNVVVNHDPKAPEGRKTTILGKTYLIRSVKPFDWKKHLQSLKVELKEVSIAVETVDGKSMSCVYYKTPKEVVTMFGRGICYFIPDGRTIIYDTEENLRRMLTRKPDALPAYYWSDAWKRIDRDWFALAYDGSHPQIRATKSDDPEVALLLQSPLQVVAGCDGFDDFHFHAFARYESEQLAEKMAKLIDGMCGFAGLHLRVQPVLGKVPPNAPPLAMQFVKDLLDNRRIHHQQKEVTFETQARIGFAEIAGMILAEEFKEKAAH
jgi:hypothetical protein